MALDTAFEGRQLEIPDILVFRSPRDTDLRGYVQPVYNQEVMAELGFEIHHENHCWSEKRGTVRGFHYQLPPFGQSKLIRITRGRMLDVNVDLRKGSPTFGQHVTAELLPDAWNQIFVPVGFAHCYMTLEHDTEVIFKLGVAYAPEYARGLAWNDPDLAIEWPLDEAEAIVLERDLNRSRFSELMEVFDFASS